MTEIWLRLTVDPRRSIGGGYEPVVVWLWVAPVAGGSGGRGGGCGLVGAVGLCRWPVAAHRYCHCGRWSGGGVVAAVGLSRADRRLCGDTVDRVRAPDT